MRSHDGGRMRVSGVIRWLLGLSGLAGCYLALACAGHEGVWVEQDARTWVARGESPVDAPARNPDGSANALIEIPAGTDAKWEVRKEDGALRWELRDGHPRVVRYLAYPANYGMVPSTLLASETGGDGDPLDVLVLGPTLPRGALVPVRIVGMLRLLDDGEQDDKLIAVRAGTAFSEIEDLPDLDAQFPGVTQILEIWFASYKGPGRIETRGFGDAQAANALLDRARGYALSY